MLKIGAPTGLIRFASEQELLGQPKPQGLLGRPRVLVYAAILVIFACFTVLTVEQRSLLLVDVLRDRGALLRETSEGRIENAYTLKLMNLDDVPREYTVSVSGLPGLEIVGKREFSAEPGSIQPLMITVSAPGEGMPSGIQPIHFEIAAKHDAATRVQEKSSFVLP